MSRRSPYRPSLRSLWFAVALIACVWALPWLLWPRAAAPAAHRAKTRMQVVYVRRALGESALSPIVFAVPTRWGFHWAGHTNAMQDTALAGPAAEASAYFETRPQAVAGTVAPWRLAGPALSGLAGGPTAWAESDGRVFAAGSDGSNGVRRSVSIGPALEMRGFNFNLPLPPPSTNGASAPWLMAQAMVELDSAGIVAHVVLDSPSVRPEWDQALVRALRSAQADAADAPARGSVRVVVSGP